MDTAIKPDMKRYYSPGNMFTKIILAMVIFLVIYYCGGVIYGLIFFKDNVSGSLEGLVWLPLIIFSQIFYPLPALGLSILFWKIFKLNYSLWILILFFIIFLLLTNFVLTFVTGTRQIEMLAAPFLCSLPGFLWIWLLRLKGK